MATCKKCKTNLGFFDTKNSCEDCDIIYCNTCAATEIVECEYCAADYCKKCLLEHTPDCKEENETADEDEDEDTTEDDEELDGVYISKDKSICIMDIENNALYTFIDLLPRLLKEYHLDEKLSNDKELVWIKNN